MTEQQRQPREDRAAAGQARSAARQLLLADGVAVALLGALTALLAGRLAGPLAPIPLAALQVIGVVVAVYGVALALLARRQWPPRRRTLLAVVGLNVVWMLAVGLWLGIHGGETAAAGRWLLTATAVLAGTFAALEWMVPRQHLP